MRLAALLLPLPLLAAPAVAEEREIAGRMRCEAVPGLTGGPSTVDLRLFVEGPAVRYERPVRVRRGEAPATEQGTGGWAPNGPIALRGAASGAGWSYTARYAGMLGPDGKGQLQGEQAWSHGGRQHARPCTISLGGR